MTVDAATTPNPFAGYGEDAALDLDLESPAVAAQVVKRLLSPDFEDFSDQLTRVGFCANPIHLTGSSTTLDAATGEVLSTYCSDQEPGGSTLVRCGNRRASECPSCSRIYAADMFHLIRAGVAGGKGVPDTISENPLVFATLTAPSFGHVHGTRDNHRRCRPRAKNPRCPHGRPATCMAFHDDEDPQLGHPLCWECYDYASHVVWQWWAPELWRRFTIALRRALAQHLAVRETKLNTRASLQYAKVGEYQRRGLIHFHALIRLDGPKVDGAFGPAPADVDADKLSDLIRDAAASVRFTAPPMFAGDSERVLALGAQVDARHVRTGHRTDDPGKPLAPEQVAGYLAKYSTKSASDTTDQGNAHLHRIKTVADEFARAVEDEWNHAGRPVELRDWPYGLLGKWVHDLGFRGHFASKSRRYSVTLGQLRRARRRAQLLLADAQRRGEPVDLASMEAQLLADDDAETTLIVGSWSFAGIGWDTPGDVALAKAAAARAREHAQDKAAKKRVSKPD
ncbi:replication initiator [Pedococcus sp. NPDC057267]|uniref:replication initiator n=1 Tax=Pedococcus sp. NPDC057267 TaxID=3346077 RepID=UPI003626EBA1